MPAKLSARVASAECGIALMGNDRSRLAVERIAAISACRRPTEAPDDEVS